MKTARKTLAVLLAVVMMSALCFSAFAATGDKHDLIIDSGAGSSIKDDEITEGTDYTLPASASAAGISVPAGKVLYAWSVKIGSTGTATVYPITSTATKLTGTTLTDDVYLSPVWGYTVTYDKNEGTGTAPDSVTVPANTEISFTFAVPSAITPPTGKTFAYWELGSTKYGAGATATLTFTNNATIEAIYETTVTVNFKKGEEAATGDTISNVKVPKVYFLPTLAEANDKRPTGAAAIAAPTGKVFAGWKVGTSTTIYQPGDLVTLTGGEDIVAQWKKHPNTITINGAQSGHTFKAYQIFTGDAAGSKLSNIQWGDAYPSSTERTALAAALKAYDWKFDDSDTDKAAELAALTASSPAAAFAQIINYIKTTNDSEELLDLAEILAENADTSAAIAPDETSPAYIFEDLDDGYYVVADETTGLTDDDFISDYILEVVNDVTVNVKGSVPTVDKKVSEDNGTTYEDTAAEDPMGVQVGDTLNYKIEGTLPTNYADYKEYGIVFTDTMDEGLTLDKTSIKLYIDAIEVAADDYDISYPTYTGGTQMVVKIVDLKAETPDSTSTGNYDTVYGVTYDSKITLKYNCVVNEKAVLDADGVENKVVMNFTNDPNQESTGDPTTGGTTPPDETVVEVTNFKFVKTDGSSNALLIGAEFKLYDASNTEIKFVACYIDSVSGEEVVVDPKNDTEVAKTEYYRVATAEELAVAAASSKITTIKVINKDQVIVDGLDADELYYLEETVAPEGYNKLTAKIEIQPNKDTDTAEAGIDTTNGKYDSSSNTGTIYNIQNNSGMELPATGGMGTVIFVAIGAIVFMATMLVLVTKKRLYNEG